MEVINEKTLKGT